MVKKRKKGQIAINTTVYVIIGLIVLAIGIAIYIYLKSKGIGFFTYIKNLKMFGA